MPYSVSAEEELPDALEPSYDTDWEERIFDPVPGAEVYLGSSEIRMRSRGIGVLFMLVLRRMRGEDYGNGIK
jgi:hypothetical protein